MSNVAPTPQDPEQLHHRTKMAVCEVATIPVADELNSTTITEGDLEAILGSLTLASLRFTETTTNQVAYRAKTIFDVSEPSPDQHIKTVFSHRDFGRTKGDVLMDTDAMAMVDQALGSEDQNIPLFCTGFPMKVFNPLETEYQGDSVDLADISVLLRFAELGRVLTHFGEPIDKSFSIVVVSDGILNEGMFKVNPEICNSYVAKLNAMIHKLGIESFVSVQEFFTLIDPDTDLKKQHDQSSSIARAEHHTAFDELLDLEDLGQSIEAAQMLEREQYGSSSFGQLFHSTIGSVRYKGIERICETFGTDFMRTYAIILESILWDRSLEQAATYFGLLESIAARKRMGFSEKLQLERSETMRMAWNSTIEYLAGLAVAKATNALERLFPGGIRLTTRPKKGQIGVHTSDQNAPSLFSYHSVPVIVPSNKGKNVKLDFQLRSSAMKNGYERVMLNGDDLVCYRHPDILSSPIDQLPWRRGSK